MGRGRRRRDAAKPTKERVKEVMEEVEDMGLPEGAYWMMVHEQLGLEYGDVFEYIEADPGFFGAVEV